MLSARTVKDLMKSPLVVVSDSDTLAFAGQLLLWRNVRHLPVVDRGGILVGMLSDRDLLSHVLEGPAGSRPVAEFMSREFVVVEPNTPLHEAATLLSKATVDALPVLQGTKLVGILTASDVLTDRGRSLRKAHAATTPRAMSIMSQRLVTARADDSLQSAINKLVEAEVRHLPIVDEDYRIVGLLSDRDVRAALGDPRKTALGQTFPPAPPSIANAKVAEFMSSRPICVGPDMSVTDVAAIFVDERVGAVPVVRDDDTVVGIISYVDVISHFVGRDD